MDEDDLDLDSDIDWSAILDEADAHALLNAESRGEPTDWID